MLGQYYHIYDVSIDENGYVKIFCNDMNCTC